MFVCISFVLCSVVCYYFTYDVKIIILNVSIYIYMCNMINKKTNQPTNQPTKQTNKKTLHQLYSHKYFIGNTAMWLRFVSSGFCGWMCVCVCVCPCVHALFVYGLYIFFKEAPLMSVRQHCTGCACFPLLFHCDVQTKFLSGVTDTAVVIYITTHPTCT